MREDEVEALLAIDGAGLYVEGDVRSPYAQGAYYRAMIGIPKDFHIRREDHPDFLHNNTALAFTGYGTTRAEAVANAWQKYQSFAESELGLRAIEGARGQMMFRV